MHAWYQLLLYAKRRPPFWLCTTSPVTDTTPQHPSLWNRWPCFWFYFDNFWYAGMQVNLQQNGDEVALANLTEANLLGLGFAVSPIYEVIYLFYFIYSLCCVIAFLPGWRTSWTGRCHVRRSRTRCTGALVCSRQDAYHPFSQSLRIPSSNRIQKQVFHELRVTLRTNWLENAYWPPLFQRAILTCKVGQTDLVLTCDQGSLVSFCIQDYKFLCASFTICSCTMANI